MKVDVVGAGFSGLVTAFYLSEKGCKVRVFEKERQPGGLIQTIAKPSGLVETAANALMNSEAVEDLFKKIDLPLVRASNESRARYIFRSRPRRWPISISATIALLPALWKILSTNKTVWPKPDESVREWGRRVLGFEATSYLLEPGLQGIYAGDAGQMSATLILGREFKWKRVKNRRHRYRGSVSAPEGMGQLIKKLETYLRQNGVEFFYGSTRPASSESLVFYCGSAIGASEWLKDIAPSVSRDLAEIEVRPVTTITAFFKPERADVKGFGMLFPRDQRVDALGVLFNNHIFAKRSELRSETWIYSGNAGIDNVLKDRQRLAGRSEPIDHVVTHWEHAIPHYTIELERVLRRGLELPPNIYLVGNYLGDIGLAKLLDRAKRTVDEAIK